MRRPGDFLQFWRTNKSGHSVVFLEWVEEDGRRLGSNTAARKVRRRALAIASSISPMPTGREGHSRSRADVLLPAEWGEQRSRKLRSRRLSQPATGAIRAGLEEAGYRNHARGLVRHIRASSAAAIAAQMRIA